MARAIFFIFLSVLATLFLPFYLQALLYIAGLFFLRYRWVLLVSALFADSWYSPVRNLSLENNKTTVFVLVILVLFFLITSNTRISQKYGLEKK